jgi:hypothetical protein
VSVAGRVFKDEHCPDGNLRMVPSPAETSHLKQSQISAASAQDAVWVGLNSTSMPTGSNGRRCWSRGSIISEGYVGRDHCLGGTSFGAIRRQPFQPQ